MLAVVVDLVSHPWKLALSSLAAILAALGTGVLAWFTWRLARATQKLATGTRDTVEAAREQAQISRVALQTTVRPFLVGVPLGLPDNQIPESVEYRDRVVEVSDRGAVDVATEAGAVWLSAPFRNVGTGIALIVGAWARPGDNSGRVTGGPSLGIVGPSEIARCLLETPGYRPVEAAIEQGLLVFGVQYTDADGAQGLISETEVRRRQNGKWTIGRTSVYHTDGSYPDRPFAFGGW